MDIQVQKFYNKFYKSFDASRVRIWKGLREFITSIQPGCTILEAGCGNGKNLGYLQKLGFKALGFDFSEELLKICQKKEFDVKYGDIRKIPFKDDSVDNIICIAVLHHLDKEKDRVQAVNEMIRTCKPGGRILVTVWAVEQETEEKRNFQFGDNMVKYEDDFRYYYIYDEPHIKKFVSKFNVEGKTTVEKFFWEKGNWFFQIKLEP
jgi:SAM-dependent methyltransferase